MTPVSRHTEVRAEDLPPERGLEVLASAEDSGLCAVADRDGRGDWLVYGQVPAGTEWTSAEVRVYTDSDNDVGDGTPVEADGAIAGLNGYNDMKFDRGYNTTDPDAAWIHCCAQISLETVMPFPL